MRATTEVDWHVNVWFEQINGPQIYRGKLCSDVLANKGLINCPHKLGHDDDRILSLFGAWQTHQTRPCSFAYV